MLVEIVTTCLLIAWGPFPTQRRRNSCNVTELECFLLTRLGALTQVNREEWRIDTQCLPEDVYPFYTPQTTHLPASKVVFQCPDAQMLLYIALDSCELPLECVEYKTVSYHLRRFTNFTRCWQSVLYQVLSHNEAVVRLEGHSSWLEMLRHVLDDWRQWRVGTHKDHTLASYILQLMGADSCVCV